MYKAFLSLIIFLLAFPAQAEQGDQWGYGPVEIFNHYPLAAPHATWSQTSPEVLDQGEASARASFSWGNTYGSKDSYRIDAETRELRLEFDYGVTPRFELGVDLPLFWRGGGVLDEAIDGWHDFFDMPEGGRPDVPADQFFLGGLQDSTAPFRVHEDGTTLGNVALQAKYLVTKGSDTFPAVSLEGRVALPTTKTNLGHGSVDTTLGLVASKRFGSFFLYTGASWIYYSDTEISQIRYESHHAELFAALEYELSSAWYIQTGVIWSGETVNNISQHPNHSLYWDFSAAYLIDQKTAFELLVRENISAARGTIDVDFLLGLNHRFSLS